MRLFLVPALALMSCLVAAGQEPPKPLLPIDRPAGIRGETRCPPFFAKTAATFVVFWYRNPDGSTNRDSIMQTRTRYEIYDDQAQAPTYEEATMPDGYKGALFRLNRTDYEKARACLSP